MNTLQLATTVLGENHSVLQRSSVKAQQKVKGLFGILLIPALLWGLGGFGVAYSLMDCGVLTAILTGIISAWLILKVDLAFMQLNTNGKGWGSNVYRLTIVLIGCTINSLLVDSILFKQDYMQIAKRMHQSEVDSTYKKGNMELYAQLASKKGEYHNLSTSTQDARKDYVKEADGTGGSGERGLKAIALAKKAVYDQLTMQLDNLSEDIRQMEAMLSDKQLQSYEEEGEPGLFTKLEALVEHTFLSGKKLMIFIYLLMFGFVVMLEFSPIVFKSRMEETDYDIWKATDELNKKRNMQMEAERIRRMHERMANYTAADWRVVESLTTAKLLK